GDGDRRMQGCAREMGPGGWSGRAELHLCLIGLRVSDETRQVAGGQIIACDQQERVLDYECDRLEVGHSVVGRIPVKRLALRKGVGAAENELIAIRRRPCHAVGAGYAAPSANAFDDHLLTQKLGEARAKDSRQNVGSAAGGEGHHHGRRTRRISLRPSETRGGRQRGSARGQMQKISAGKFHLEPPLASHHSITSSARASSVSGTVSPSPLAVLRLSTSSYLVGACTGRSAGFSPLRIRST